MKYRHTAATLSLLLGGHAHGSVAFAPPWAPGAVPRLPGLVSTLHHPNHPRRSDRRGAHSGARAHSGAAATAARAASSSSSSSFSNASPSTSADAASPSLRAALGAAARRLDALGVPDAELSCEYLLAKVRRNKEKKEEEDEDGRRKKEE